MAGSRDDEDLAGRGLGDALRDAPQHEAAKTPAAVGPEDDEVGEFRFRGRQDGLRGLAFPHQEGCPSPDGSRPQDDGLGAPLDTCPLFVDAPEEQASGQAEPRWIHDAEHDQVRGAFDGQLDRPVGRADRDRRQVGREDDLRDPATLAARALSVVGARRGQVRAQVDAARNPFHDDHHHDAGGPATVTSGPIPRAERPGRSPDRRTIVDVTTGSKIGSSAAAPGQIQDALDAAVRGIAELASLDDVLQIIVDRVRPLAGAEYAALGIVDAEGRIERFITSGMDDETRRRIGALPEGKGLLGLIIQKNRSFRVPDMNRDPRRYGFPPNHPPMTSFLGVPIAVKGVSLGRLYLTNKLGAVEFSAQDQSLVETFALHAAIAMENARLHERLQRLAVVDERDRISQDLHDGIIQNMYAVSLSLEDVPELMADDRDEAAARVERAIESIHLSIQDIRNLIFGLRPELLEGTSLAGGLAALVEESRHNTMIDFELRVPDTPTGLPEGVIGQLLGIVNESLSNVMRHSRASRALVVLAARDDGTSWEITIEDNGVGFDPTSVVKLGHRGLANIRERAGQVNGTATVDSRPGSGTRVVVRVPLRPE